jgi:amino acid transporter
LGRRGELKFKQKYYIFGINIKQDILARARKFGTFGGVFTPSILTILGVIMFMRLPWIVGQAGLWSTLAIILVAHIISASTGLSVSSVATDKKVETGGTYFIISRSLGLPIGGTLGIALFVGLSFSVSLYLIGFSEAFLSYWGYEVNLQSIRLVGTIMLVLVTILTIISTSLVIKTQYLIMGAMLLSLLSIFFGSHSITPAAPQYYTMPGALPWIALFAIFFPAVTGFEAGVSMSGDLKDPRKSIPLGTISAIVVGLLIYVGLAVFFSFTVDPNHLVGNAAVLFDIAFVPQLVIAGILGATLSSALGSILGAPRIMQAVAADKILPRFFAKGHGISNEPRNALYVTFAIALSGILIGELNVIARIVTIFFIITYGFLNITYALESWAGSDFRPSFKIPRFVSIIGALACIIVMIQLDVLAMIGASLVLMVIFIFLKKREITLHTGDTWNSIWASLVKTGLGRLANSSRKPKNWRPNVILFSGGKKSRPYLIDMGRFLVGKLGIFTNFELIESQSQNILLRKDQQIITEEDQDNKPGEVFTRRHLCKDIYEGIDSISKIYGFSGFEPNTILMGWGRRTRDPKKFARLLDNFNKLDYNTVFLNYDKDKGYGNFSSVDFWWSGKGRNLSLALTLMKFLTSGSGWQSARLRIIVINRHTEMTENYYRLIQQLLENNRMNAQVKVINNRVEQLPENQIIHAESLTTDLTILELPHEKGIESSEVIDLTNKLINNLGTCLLIKASAFFEEHSVIRHEQADEEESEEDEKGIPVPDIIQQLNVSSSELIANEVFNTARNYSQHAQRFYLETFEPFQHRNAELYRRLGEFTAVSMSNLQATLQMGDSQQQDREWLRLMNDFSFYALQNITFIKEGLESLQKDVLERSINQYLASLRHSASVVPESIRIRLPGSAFHRMPSDKMKVRLYKIGKKIQAKLTGKPVMHKIKVSPATRYFLLYRRLLWMDEFLNAFSRNFFAETAAVRKHLTELQQTIEMSRMIRHNAEEKVKMERSRLIAAVSVMQKDNRKFFLDSGISLYSSLKDDIQQFNNYLDNPGLRPWGSDFPSQQGKIMQLQEHIEDFPGLMRSNAEGFVNKLQLDFMMLSLKNRILSKLLKYKEEMKHQIELAMLRPMRTYKVEEKDGNLVVPGFGFREMKLDFSLMKDPNLRELFRPMYEEVSLLASDLPEVILISDTDLTQKVEQGDLESAGSLEINLRKSVSFFLGAELLDKVRKQVDEGDLVVQKTIHTLRDIIRLVNFNLEGDPEMIAEVGAEQRRKQNNELMGSLHQRLREEQAELIRMYRSIENAFDEGLKNAFEPLSSALISKYNIALKQKAADQPASRISRKINRQMKELKQHTQQQIVNLLYSKSEGLLWVSRFEQKEGTRKISNKDFLSFAEALTPSAQVLKELPFYYSSLFSGKSGVSEDFWVGMKDEISSAEEAVRRFNSGIGGAVIVTGERGSGKSSLCKLICSKHFQSDNVHSLRAPKASTSSVADFSQSLLDILDASNHNLGDVFQAMPHGKVIIINDLELWWERRPGGMAVINYIQGLIDSFGHKCLFILNCNTHSFNILDNACDLRSFALSTILCKPFDARELREMILLRHQAGGLKFVYNNKHESRMSALDHARLFNYFFDLSKGNPGNAIALWLASIKQIKEKTLLMEALSLPSHDIFDQLNQEQMFYILQLVLHRRLSAMQMAESFQMPYQMVMSELRKLQRAAILEERFDGVFTLNKKLENHFVEKLKSQNLL